MLTCDGFYTSSTQTDNTDRIDYLGYAKAKLDLFKEEINKLEKNPSFDFSDPSFMNIKHELPMLDKNFSKMSELILTDSPKNRT